MSISLRTRIAVTVILLITVVVVVTLSVAYHEMVEAMYYTIDRPVMRDTDVVREVLLKSNADARDDEQTLSEITKALSEPDKIRSPLYRVWIEGESGDLLASDLPSSERYRALANVPLLGCAVKRKRRVTTITIEGQEYRALAMLVSLPESKLIVNVVIAAPCDYAIDEIEEFRKFMLVLGGIVIVVAGAVAGLLVHDAMRSVNALADRLHRITHQNLLDSPIECASIPSDLCPFAESVSTMLDRLGRAFEQQKRFTADAAHELRSPLTVAKSTIQATLAMPECNRDYVEMAMSELDDLRRMEHLIEQLLVLAHLEEKALVPDEQIELQSLLVESVSLSEESSQSASVVIEESIPQVVIRGHRDELLRLLSNLIDNAVRYGPAGGTVTVSAETFDERGVRITVRDEGGSIPPEAISHLTERFYRVDVSRARATGGIGLGLSIAAEIAKRHGGGIKIQSSPEKGTSVTLSLTIC